MTKLYKNVNGVNVELTPAEYEEYYARQAEWEAQSSARLMVEYTSALENAINLKAKEKSYSSAVSCASYKDSTNAQWAAEASAFIAWRDNCYEYGYDYLANVENGTIANPTIEDFINGLPVLEWPTT